MKKPGDVSRMSEADRSSMQDFRVWFKGQPAKVRERVLYDLRCEHEYLLVGDRLSTGFPSLDRALGGGIARGSTLLVYGPRGVGRTTLLLRVAEAAAIAGEDVVFASGEMTAADVSEYAQRLGLRQERVNLLCDVAGQDVYGVAEVAEGKGASLLVVDSLLTIRCEDVSRDFGTRAQQMAVMNYLSSFAQATGCVVLVVGHALKDGSLAVPHEAEHLADGVLRVTPSDGLSSPGVGGREVLVERHRHGPAPTVVEVRLWDHA